MIRNLTNHPEGSFARRNGYLLYFRMDLMIDKGLITEDEAMKICKMCDSDVEGMDELGTKLGQELVHKYRDQC
jgi:hypothetical protein